jgi:hypothetical protein
MFMLDALPDRGDLSGRRRARNPGCQPALHRYQSSRHTRRRSALACERASNDPCRRPNQWILSSAAKVTAGDTHDLKRLAGDRHRSANRRLRGVKSAPPEALKQYDGTSGQPFIAG